MATRSHQLDVSCTDDLPQRVYRNIRYSCREHLASCSPIAPWYQRSGYTLITNLPADDPRVHEYPMFLRMHQRGTVIAEPQAYGLHGQRVHGWIALYVRPSDMDFLDQHHDELRQFFRSPRRTN